MLSWSYLHFNVVSLKMYYAHYVLRKVTLCVCKGGQEAGQLVHSSSSLKPFLAVKLHLIFEGFLCNIYCLKVVTASWLARNDTLWERKHLYLFFFCTAAFSCPPHEMVIALIWFLSYFVLRYKSLFIACKTITYVVLYLFTVHISCT